MQGIQWNADWEMGKDSEENEQIFTVRERRVWGENKKWPWAKKLGVKNLGSSQLCTGVSLVDVLSSFVPLGGLLSWFSPQFPYL